VQLQWTPDDNENFKFGWWSEWKGSRTTYFHGLTRIERTSSEKEAVKRGTKVIFPGLQSPNSKVAIRGQVWGLFRGGDVSERWRTTLSGEKILLSGEGKSRKGFRKRKRVVRKDCQEKLTERGGRGINLIPYNEEGHTKTKHLQKQLEA